MNRYFDQIYFTLSFVILVALAYSTFAGLKLRKLESNLLLKRCALGISFIAIGTAITLLAGLLADLFLKRSTLFQQARFALFYIGFALNTLGLETVAEPTQARSQLPSYLKPTRVTSSLIWVLFLATLAISGFYLVNPNTFIINQYGYQIQLQIYWLPMLTISVIGAIFLFLLAIMVKHNSERGHLLWIGAYFAMIFIGLLRESLILPSLGDPLSDMLVAYVPFTLGSICLGIGARTLLNNSIKK
jgi:hypothetical protein